MSAKPRCISCGRSLGGNLETVPFCSARCRDVDLGNWFLERYRVSRMVDPEDDQEELQAALGSLEEDDLEAGED